MFITVDNSLKKSLRNNFEQLRVFNETKKKYILQYIFDVLATIDNNSDEILFWQNHLTFFLRILGMSLKMKYKKKM